MSGAAIPIIGAVGSSLFGGGSGGAQRGLAPAISGLTNNASFFSRTGAPLLSSAANYYQKLLGNSRAGLQQAIAPITNQIADTYRGAQGQLDYSGVRGPQKDVAEANLAREKAGAIAGVPFQAKTAAVASAAGLGQNLGQMSTSALTPLLGEGQRAYEFNTGQGNLSGEALGGMFAQLLKGFGGPSASPAMKQAAAGDTSIGLLGSSRLGFGFGG